MKLETLKKILRDFYEISGMEISVLDRKYHNVMSYRRQGESFCSYIHKSPACLELCLQSDTVALNRAERERGLLTYVCPFGVREAIAPIEKNGMVVGYLFLAMGIEEAGHSDSIPRDTARSVAPSLNGETLAARVSELPHYSGAKMDAYASLLPMIAAHIEENELLSNTDRSIAWLIKSYINDNLSEKITLADLSWNLHCSTVTLTEHFKREFGMTIMQYVTAERMKKAEHLLRTDASVSEISESCGFSDVEYFSRCFKSRHGVSPAAWRKRYKETGERKGD